MTNLVKLLEDHKEGDAGDEGEDEEDEFSMSISYGDHGDYYNDE